MGDSETSFAWLSLFQREKPFPRQSKSRWDFDGAGAGIEVMPYKKILPTQLFHILQYRFCVSIRFHVLIHFGNLPNRINQK